MAQNVFVTNAGCYSIIVINSAKINWFCFKLLILFPMLYSEVKQKETKEYDDQRNRKKKIEKQKNVINERNKCCIFFWTSPVKISKTNDDRTKTEVESSCRWLKLN